MPLGPHLVCHHPSDTSAGGVELRGINTLGRLSPARFGGGAKTGLVGPFVRQRTPAATYRLSLALTPVRLTAQYLNTPIQPSEAVLRSHSPPQPLHASFRCPCLTVSLWYLLMAVVWHAPACGCHLRGRIVTSEESAVADCLIYPKTTLVRRLLYCHAITLRWPRSESRLGCWCV